MADKDKRVVWEHRKGGSRFMTAYTEGETYESNEHHIVVETDVSVARARQLCDERSMETAIDFISDLPPELRDPETDAYIASLIRGGMTNPT